MRQGEADYDGEMNTWNGKVSINHLTALGIQVKRLLAYGTRLLSWRRAVLPFSKAWKVSREDCSILLLWSTVGSWVSPSKRYSLSRSQARKHFARHWWPCGAHWFWIIKRQLQVARSSVFILWFSWVHESWDAEWKWAWMNEWYIFPWLLIVWVSEWASSLLQSK